MEIKRVDVLLVEDNLYDAELSIRALRKAKTDSHLLHVKNGEEAWEFLLSTGKYEGRDITSTPSVILLDLKMPGMNGMELLALIKANEVTKKIPVVVLTSSTADPNMKRCYELGAHTFIVKPVEADKYIDVVTKLGLYWLVEKHAA